MRRILTSLPALTPLFTWFFVVPGAVLLLISAYGLGAFDWIGRHAHVPRHPAPTH